MQKSVQRVKWSRLKETIFVFVLGAAGFLLIAVLAIAVLGGAFDPNAGPRVIATENSPEGGVQAILEVADCGAPCTPGYTVSLKPAFSTIKPVPVAYLDSAMESEHKGGLKMVWLDDKTVELRYLTAEHASVVQPVADINGDQITVHLHNIAK
jgi:hypothetical protein